MQVTDVVAYQVQDRAGWLAMRKQDVTASDVGAVLGVSPYSSALQVYAEKTGQVTVEETNIMVRGRWFEDAGLAALKETNPTWHCWKPALYLRSPSLRIGATPDVLVRKNGASDRISIVQIKVVAKSVYEREWVDGVPLYYQLQTLTEAKLANAVDAYVGVLIVGEFSVDWELIPVEIHDAAFDKIVEGVAEFWRIVDSGQRPPADYGKDGAVISQLYQANKMAEPVDLSHDNRMLMLCLDDANAKAIIKEQEAIRAAIKAEVVEKLNGAPKATCGDWKISNTPISVGEKVVKAYSFDRLTISEKKG